ncbi:Protein MET1 chloroplastic [Bienertia sinuspersici]
MASSIMAGASSSCSVSFSPITHPSSSSKQCPPLLPQKTNFHGLSLQDAKRVIFSSLLSQRKSNSSATVKRGLEIRARTTGAAKTIEVEVDKPLGLTLGQKPGGGVLITAVDGGGNAAKAGLKSGDQVLYTSSFFGDELWPADKLGFTKTAIQAKPDSVYFVVNRGGADVDVKKLPKRPAPPRFGRKLTPKKRFARYDVNTGKAVGGNLPPIGVIIGLLAGVGAVGALLVYGLQ